MLFGEKQIEVMQAAFNAQFRCERAEIELQKAEERLSAARKERDTANAERVALEASALETCRAVVDGAGA